MSTKTYLFKEGIDNLKKHSSKTFSCILIICATMLLSGIFVILLLNINANVNIVKEEQGLQALLEENLTDEDIEYIEDELAILEGVKDTVYLSKEDAFEDAKEVFADQIYFLDGLEDELPFPASIVVTFDDIERAEIVKEKALEIEGVYKVKYNQSTINAVILFTQIVNYFVLGLGSVMLIISMFIISNTIKLAVYSNKREIYIMKYIGATNSFIKTPFIIEGAIMGVISSIISFVIISGGYILAYSRLPQFGTSLGIFGFLPYSSVWYITLTVFLVIGLFIGIVGSSISMRKYLKV